MPYPSTSLYPSTTLYPAAATVPEVRNVFTVDSLAGANPSITATGYIGSGDVLVLAIGGSGGAAASAVSGCGATWTRAVLSASAILEVWVGTGATSSGTVTATAASSTHGLALFVVNGTTTTVAGAAVSGTGLRSSTPQNAGPGQVVLGTSYSSDAASTITALTPASGWTEQTVAITAGTAFMGTVYRVPPTNESHTFSAQRPSGNTYVAQIVLGDPVSSGIDSAFSGSGTLTSSLQRNIASSLTGSGTLASSLHRNISSNLSGSGTLVTVLTGYQDIDSQFSGSGTLTSVLGRQIHSDFTGSGSLSSALVRHIESALSGSGTLTSQLLGYQEIASDLSGSGTLTSVLVYGNNIESNFYGTGYLQSVLTYSPRFNSHFSGQGVLYSELFYATPPAELGTTPLGKLVSFSVSTSAVPLNPAEGSGAAPSVGASYIKGADPEFALGETNVLSHGAIGTYEGEVVRLGLPRGSDVASISQDTLLTLLNNELSLFPFIDAAPSTWTAARAIDYWTQQCGLFYDKVPGDAIAYASGFGHTDSYGAGTTARFYEKLTGGTTATQVVGSRSVKTLGSAVTGTTAFHELPKGSVPVSVPEHSKLVASIGLGLRGTGRTTTVTWNMLDAKDATYNVTISATSAGLISASVAGVPIDSTSVAPNGDYRVTFSIDRVSATAVVGKLSVHTDDLAGTGTLEYSGASIGASVALPNVLHLTNITHVSAGGSGSQMLRWGTYLTVAKSHPMELPVVQKAFSATGKTFGFVSGFEGNVWALLNEYCAITRQDISFLGSQMVISSRISTLAAPLGNFSGFSRDSERRDKYKQVAVVNKQSKAVSTDDAVLWRADSVFQVAAREVFETTVQTGHSILSLVQPVAVDGILPFPYKVGGGQYVVTGADGYIIAPAWWTDNGGKVEVSLTEKQGEIAIKITAPAIDTVRAPYRISEGEADRPALYVAGSGILNDPKEVHVGTGARNAKEGFDQVFESPFIAGVMETYDTAMAMASEYSASAADVSFEIPNDFYTPSRFGQFPSATRFTDGVRNYRITSASQTHSRVSGSAVPHTTIGDYVASYPPGATLADEKARHGGRTIKQFNIKPLRGSE